MITSVKAHNFLSWEKLDLDLKPGVTLIDGWNEDDQTSEGSGKSAILNAICWCLFGKIPKDVNIDDVIKEGQKGCEVQIHFDDETVIRRSRGPNELSIIQGSKQIKGKDARETQSLIEDYLGLTFETFCQTIYFAQNYTKKFITSNQEEKGKILSEVQDLVLFDKAGKEVRSLIKLEEDALVKIKHSRELNQKELQLTQRDLEVEELKFKHEQEARTEKIANLEHQIAFEETRLETEEKQQLVDIARIEDQITEVERTIEDIKTSKAQLLESVSALTYGEAEYNALQQTNNELASQAGVIQAEINNIDKLVAHKKMAETQGRRYAARYKQVLIDRDKNLAFIANPSKDCPTCGTQLTGCDTSHAQLEINRLDTELTEIIEALTQLEADVDRPIPTKDELESQLATLRNSILANDETLSNLRAIKNKMTQTAAHLTSHDQQLTQHTLRVKNLESQLELAKQPRIVDTKNLLNLQDTLKEAKKPIKRDLDKLDALTSKLKQVQETEEELNRLKQEKDAYLRRLEELKVGFKEIKSYVFNSVLNEVNSRVRKYVDQLFEVPVTVRFRNEDMKIETDIKYDGVERSLGLLSGGQFRRISLAVDLALSDVIVARKGSRVGITVWDEYMKDLSESSMEKVLKLLESRTQPTILIEHNSIFKNIVNQVVTVKLENGTSHVEV